MIDDFEKKSVWLPSLLLLALPLLCLHHDRHKITAHEGTVRLAGDA